MIHPRVGLSLLCIAVCNQLYAAEDNVASTSSDPQTLPTVYVSATRTPTSIAEIPSKVQKISSAQITEQAAAGRKVADILSQLVPALGTSSGTTSNYGQTMHGRQVLFMVDGIPQTGSRDVARQLNSISPTLIDRIEVISGATSIYGAGATGGIINVITKRNTGESLAFHTDVGLTSSDKFNRDGLTYEIGQTASFNEGIVDGFLGANFTQRQSQYDGNGNRIAPEPAQTSRNDTGTVDLRGRLNFKLTDQQTLSVGGLYYKDQQYTQYAPDYGPNLAALLNPAFQPSLNAKQGLNLPNQPKTERSGFDIKYSNSDFLGQNLTAEGYYRREDSRFFPFVTAFSVANAAPVINALPVSAALKKQYASQLQQSAYAVLQSESKVDVAGARLALDSKFNLIGIPTKITYGVDFEKETDKQSAESFGLSQFMASNGLNYQPSGKSYGYGPDVDIRKTGLFLQSSFKLRDDLTLQAGVRHERIESQSDGFTSTADALLGDLLANYKLPYKAGTIGAGSVTHQETLFNVGAVYDLNKNQQLFTNFSQGFSLPDMQRLLRDVQPGFVVQSSNVDPIKVNSVEAGWRIQQKDSLNASVTAFYNTSDKVTQFQKDFSVSVADTDQRIYGAEGSIDLPIAQDWRAGGSLAYTSGQFKDANGKWRELNSFTVSPLKGTLFAEYNRDHYGLRLQMLAVGGTDQAYKDSLKAAYSPTVRPTTAAKIQGFSVMDLLGHVDLPKGKLSMGIYNLWNTDYRSVYSQEAVAIYGKTSGIPAEGRTVAFSYSIDY
ncbi:TonB-dependent receptor [Aquirhabdus sp.]|uniref:TonB-dependent receptor n=1 Tax=Aquirhabdus sp. TaxID=2824160 RepID=UPI00396CC8BA